MTVLSNGKLMGEKEEGELTVFHWLQEKPHVNYLVSVVAGYLKNHKADFRGIPIGFYTPPSDFPQAENSFVDTADILAFFEEEIGVPYPWDKYYSVAVQGYPYGGMENTSVTTLTTRTLFAKETEQIHTTRHLDAHEIAHQWFGDLVTCKDWTHLWLNEGFATYYTELYEEHKNGRDHLLYRMHRNAQGVINSKDDKPIAWREYSRPWDQFDYRAYPKGSWVLHMLRSQLGKDLYRKVVKTYLDRHSYDVAVTEDLNEVLEDVTGRSFDQFFDQWVYHGGVPKLNVDYKWDAKAKKAKITVAQTQKVTDKVLLFQFPLPVRFHTKDGIEDFEVEITKVREDFYFDLKDAPTVARIDPEFTVLANLTVKLPKLLVEAQVELEEDMLGRFFAVKLLGDRKDQKALDLLTTRLQSDPFFGVRLQAADEIANLGTPEAQKALSESLEQPDARVRQKVVQGIGKFYNEAALTTLVGITKSESNPEIIARAAEALGKFPNEEVPGAILAMLSADSFRHRIEMAAITAMKKQDLDVFVAPLLKHLQDEGSEFIDRDFGKALKVLGFLARNQEDRETVRTFIAGFVSDPRTNLHLPAIEALADLGDTRSVAMLEALVVEDGPRQKIGDAARKAAGKLQGGKPVSQELKDLRGEVLDLQTELKEMRAMIEKLKK